MKQNQRWKEIRHKFFNYKQFHKSAVRDSVSDTRKPSSPLRSQYFLTSKTWIPYSDTTWKYFYAYCTVYSTSTRPKQGNIHTISTVEHDPEFQVPHCYFVTQPFRRHDFVKCITHFSFLIFHFISSCAGMQRCKCEYMYVVVVLYYYLHKALERAFSLHSASQSWTWPFRPLLLHLPIDKRSVRSLASRVKWIPMALPHRQAVLPCPCSHHLIQ